MAAWIIDRDMLAEQQPESERAKPGTNDNAVGVMGPRSITEAERGALKLGCGMLFCMLDDDGEVYYEGRFYSEVDPYAQSERAFAPLENFGTPNAGATTIKYLRAGLWETL